jgi:hypothetical protein
MYFALIVGLVVIFFGIRMHRKKKALAKTGVMAKAVIIDNREGDFGGRVLHFPVIEIMDGPDTGYEVVMNEGTNWIKKVGKEMTVVYPHGDPDSAHEHTKGMNMGSIVLILVGSLFSLIGFVAIVLNYLWDYLTTR